MDKKKISKGKLGLVLGILGMLSGIGLLFSGKLFIGIFGFMASGFITYLGYKEYKTRNNQ